MRADDADPGRDDRGWWRSRCTSSLTTPASALFASLRFASLLFASLRFSSCFAEPRTYVRTCTSVSQARPLDDDNLAFWDRSTFLSDTMNAVVYWDLVSMVALFYTAIIAPYQVGPPRRRGSVVAW
mmetsp:Transcript_44028/g.120065  ORF Transcript_44028/g.120065 Transcript_44028/m.120065 type:complete len:126 (+) Transcript_44028:23-400(+)